LEKHRIVRRFFTDFAICLIFSAGFASSTALAVTQYKASTTPFVHDVRQLSPSLSLQVIDEPEFIKIPEAKLIKRLKRSPRDNRVEPLTLVLTTDKAQQEQLASRLALPGKSKDLAKYFAEIYPKGEKIKPNGNARSVNLDSKGFRLIDRKAYAEMYGKVHHKLKIDTAQMLGERGMGAKLIEQTSNFLSRSEQLALKKDIQAGRIIDVDTQLLPDFAERMVKKYIIYRGPNCFHAALAFHSPVLTSSSLLNVKEEEGYHRAMINYDELWRILQTKFYEVDPRTADLNYGDLLIFFDVPKGFKEGSTVDYRWIRHTAAYLFGGYTFSKGSKSPNTPYSVRTLEEEWQTWKRFTSHLGLKVFRRSEKSVNRRPPKELTDWIY
jgi:hypothetical protein